MRAMLIALLVVSGLWAGYWVVGSRAVERSIEAWFAAPHDGLTASRSDVSVSGFPNRFDAANRRTGSNLMIHGACSSSGSNVRPLAR